MLSLDIEQFWKDEELAHKENCFSKTAPQVALGIRMSDECVFAELGEEGKPWGVCVGGISAGKCCRQRGEPFAGGL